MKLVAWLGGPKIDIIEDSWLALSISGEDVVLLLSMNAWITLNGGTFIPLEVDE